MSAALICADRRKLWLPKQCFCHGAVAITWHWLRPAVSGGVRVITPTSVSHVPLPEITAIWCSTARPTSGTWRRLACTLRGRSVENPSAWALAKHDHSSPAQPNSVYINPNSVYIFKPFCRYAVQRLLRRHGLASSAHIDGFFEAIPSASLQSPDILPFDPEAPAADVKIAWAAARWRERHQRKVCC